MSDLSTWVQRPRSAGGFVALSALPYRAGERPSSDTPTRSLVRWRHKSQLSAELLMFGCAEWFGENVTDHVVRRDVGDLDPLVFNKFADEVVLDVHVLQTTIVCRIDCEENSALVV